MKSKANLSSSIVLGLSVAFIMMASDIFSPQAGLTDTASDETTIVNLVTNNVTKGRTVSGITFQVTELSIDGTYALAEWTWGQGGGEQAFTSPQSGKWNLLASGGGYLTARGLAAYGVPLPTAKLLIAGLINCPPELRHPLSVAGNHFRPLSSGTPAPIYACALGASAPSPTPSPVPSLTIKPCQKPPCPGGPAAPTSRPSSRPRYGLGALPRSVSLISSPTRELFGSDNMLLRDT